METNRKYIILSALTALAILLSSCGRAGFDATIKPADVKDIDLSYLQFSGYIIKVETYVETGDFGIDLSKLIYSYTIKNDSSKSIKLEVRLSLHGEATLDDNNKVTVFTSSSGGYGTIPSEKEWLTATYENPSTIGENGYGWVSMIGTPGTPLTISANTSETNRTTITDRAVVDRILKQKGIWVDAYISPNFTFPATFTSSDLMNIINQSIEVEGSKPTGYFPGVF